MMATILNSAILHSDTLFSSLRFTQKHSLSTLTMTQTNQSDSTSIILTQLDDGSHLEFCQFAFSHLSFPSHTHSHLPRLVPTICTKKTSRIHSDSTLWWQPSWILPCWNQTLSSCIQTPSYLLWDLLKNTLSLLRIWLKLIQSDSNSFILTQLDNASHLEFCQFAFSHLSFPSQTHSHLPRLVPTICIKKIWLIHSDSTWWLQLSWILPSLFSAILYKKNFTHSFWLNLMMAAISKSAILDSDTGILDSNTLLNSLRFTQKHSYSILNMTQTNSIWLNSFILT